MLASHLTSFVPLAKAVAFLLLWSFSIHKIQPEPTMKIVAQEVNICGDLERGLSIQKVLQKC